MSDPSIVAVTRLALGDGTQTAEFIERVVAEEGGWS